MHSVARLSGDRCVTGKHWIALIIGMNPPAEGVYPCHRTVGNQPAGVDSKPATLRCGFHNRFVSGFKVSVG